MRPETFDLCVIGAGSGGLSVAAGAVQMGARVALIEAGRMGGDCLNTGCVPSKALLAAARAAAARRSGPAGVGAAPLSEDYAAAMAHVAATIAAIAPHDSAERFAAMGVRVIRGRGRFTGPRAVRVECGQAEAIALRARRFVIATGARPAIPPVEGLDGLPYLTNETLFDLRDPPAQLLILGGGPIGVEMAQAHRRLGVPVTVVEAGRLLPREDPDLSAIVRARLVDEGVTLREGARVLRASGEAGAIALDLDGGERLEGSHLLVATGRRPALGGLDLHAAGIATDGEGRLLLDRGLRTTNRRVLVVGDAAGGAQFTHLAGYQAGVVLRRMLFALPAHARTDHVPRVTYTDPELAQIGLTEAEARARYGERLTVVHLPMTENDRARAEARTDGAIKLLAVRGRAVGVGIVGDSAGEMIAPWAVIFAQRLKLGALAATVLPYPTRAELCKRAAGAYFSPKLFDNPLVKRGVGLVQRLIP